MKDKKHKITQTGLDKLKEDLDYRINIKRNNLKETIQEARDKGDLSENDGYTLALEEYESNEHTIAELQSKIDSAEVVETNGNKSVSVGSVVLVQLKDKEYEYHIVGASEGNPLDNKISEETPIGKALVGKKVGDTIKVALPMGEVEYEIVKIS